MSLVVEICLKWNWEVAFILDDELFEKYGIICERDYATGWTTGVRFLAGAEKGLFVFVTACTANPVPIQPPTYPVTRVFTPRIKRPGRDANHPPPSSAKVKNAWSYTSNPPYVFEV
jgi:hypothetical protein